MPSLHKFLFCGFFVNMIFQQSGVDTDPMKAKSTALFLFIMIIFLASIPSKGSAQSLPLVRVQPAAMEVAAEETFIVAITIENVVDLYGFDILLQFDPSLIQVTEIEMGNFLVQGIYFEDIDNSLGSVNAVNTQTNPDVSQSGSGTLVLIHFVALSETGISSIDFLEPDYLVVLSNINGEEIECRLVGGAVEVIGSGEKEDYLTYIPLVMN